MTTYLAVWEDVPQLKVSGADMFDVMARTEHEYEHMTGDPDDDPDYLTPELRWALGWNAPGKRRRLVLFRDGSVTGVHIDEVAAVNADEPDVRIMPATDRAGFDMYLTPDGEIGHYKGSQPGDTGPFASLIDRFVGPVPADWQRIYVEAPAVPGDGPTS